MTTAQKTDAIASICDDFREIIRDIGQHIAQGQQSEAQMASMRPGYGTGVYTHIDHQMRKMLALVTTLSDAQSALESERQAHAAEVERLRADAERLDFLDSLNRALNTQYGTTYQWKLVLSPNVVRLMAGRHDKGYIGDIDLHDSDAHGSASCRAAIDQAIARGKT